ncbi:hypothetical protein RhiirC2_796651 [Rhizophagus irregularis]|uniref:Uncharacterized protein n=1 Tax=Rhizophagus irregularis TaxID=588596 RepID=A0A2N1M9B9_9GLOM|nr:hypothetical protein RhiirC2_796651 [Rhizophagus irregularis]
MASRRNFRFVGSLEWVEMKKLKKSYQVNILANGVEFNRAVGYLEVQLTMKIFSLVEFLYSEYYFLQLFSIIWWFREVLCKFCIRLNFK